MLTGYVMSFKIPRFMINTLVPFIVADLGLPASLTPTLLAAFHPGYILTQVPGGLLVASKGPKFVATLQLAASAMLLGLIPRFGALGGRGSSTGAYLLLLHSPLRGVNNRPLRSATPTD